MALSTIYSCHLQARTPSERHDAGVLGLFLHGQLMYPRIVCEDPLPMLATVMKMLAKEEE